MAAISNKYAELDDHDDGEEHHIIHTPQTFLQRTKRRFPTSSTVCLLSYCLVALTTITVLLSVALLKKGSTVKCVNEAAFEGKFGRNYELQSVAHEFDHYWDGMSEDAGLLQLPDARLGGEKDEASISMFHQLHCLSSFRHAIQTAHDGKDPGLDWRDNQHWPHCFDYLRKTILCWADGTVERYPRFPNGTWITFIDGTTDVRQCGNSQKLIDQMRDAGVTLPLPDSFQVEVGKNETKYGWRDMGKGNAQK